MLCTLLMKYLPIPYCEIVFHYILNIHTHTHTLVKNDFLILSVGREEELVMGLARANIVDNE